MKRTIFITLFVLSAILLILFGSAHFISIWKIGTSQANSQETFLLASQSPDGNYKLEAYKTEPGATVDFSVKVYQITGGQKELIYNAYHEYDAKIVWLDDSTVSINEKTLDLSLGETYDWRTDEGIL